VVRWFIYGFLGLVGLLVVAVATLYLLTGHFNLASLASGRASAALGRQVTIDALHINPGRWITIEVDAARLANVPGGSRPMMVELRHLTAEVDALSLLHRPLIVRRLVVDGLSILAERTAGHTNWRFGGAKTKPSTSDSRSWFPTLLDARLNDSEVVYRTSGGATFRTTLNKLSIVTPSASQPVSLTATAADNGTTISLAGELQSIVALRDGTFPMAWNSICGRTKRSFIQRDDDGPARCGRRQRYGSA
jgi:uncharacterized protein involved in outer membrane biogenesis